MEWYLSWLQFAFPCDVKHLLMCLFAIHTYSLVKCLFKSFANILVDCLFLSNLSIISFSWFTVFYALSNKSLPNRMLENIFSYFSISFTLTDLIFRYMVYFTLIFVYEMGQGLKLIFAYKVIYIIYLKSSFCISSCPSTVCWKTIPSPLNCLCTKLVKASRPTGSPAVAASGRQWWDDPKIMTLVFNTHIIDSYSTVT